MLWLLRVPGGGGRRRRGRRSAIATARRLGQLREERTALEARAGRPANGRSAWPSSRRVLAPGAEATRPARPARFRVQLLPPARPDALTPWPARRPHRLPRRSCLALGAVLVVARAAQLQLVEGATGGRRPSGHAQETRGTLEARRGGIYDRNGVQLAVTQEYFHVGIAPNELRDRRADAPADRAALGCPLARVAAEAAHQEVDVLPRPVQRARRSSRCGSSRGAPRRAVPRGTIPPVAGRGGHRRGSADSARGGGGLELALDRLLTGMPGEAVLLKDRGGRRLRVAGAASAGAGAGARCLAHARCGAAGDRRAGAGRAMRSRGARAATSSCSIRAPASCWRWPRARQATARW